VLCGAVNYLRASVTPVHHGGMGDVRLVGGPYDGTTLEDASGDGAWMIVDGTDQRAAYDPTDDPGVWEYKGMLPPWT